VRLVQSAGPYDADGELSACEVVLTGLFGTINLYDSSNPKQRKRARELLSQVGLGPVADHRYNTLSSGEKVRCLMARALMEPPALLLLDEPTAGLDLLAREQVLATVQALHQSHSNSTVALITHHVEELSPEIDQVLLLDQGRVAACGAMQAVLRDEVLSGVYRCPLETAWKDGRCYTRVRPQAWNGLLG
jgi:iron complex transport system ATP-binding protein